MPRVIALDLSLVSTGWAASTDNPMRPVYGTLDTGHLRGPERLHHLEQLIVDRIRQTDPHVVAIEGYAYARGNNAHQIGELGGIVRLHLHRQHHTYVEIPPATLKKYATGKGNASKEKMLAEAVRRLDYPGSSNDEADALWLWTATRDAYSHPPVAMPKAHRQALDAIDWPELDLQEVPG